MQFDRDDAFSPLDVNFNDYVNDTESLHMFNTDSPSAGQMSVDPASIFLNADFAASPILSNAPHLEFQSPGRLSKGPVEDIRQEQPVFGQSPLQPRSALSSASPESSSHDSSSDSSGRRKRKSPDSSSPSNFFESYSARPEWRVNVPTAGQMDLDSKPRKPVDSLIDGDAGRQNLDLDLNMQFLSSELQKNFDFKSGGSSPKGFSNRGPGTTAPGSKARVPNVTADQNLPKLSTSKTMFTFGAPSRDNSPPSATFATNHQPSPPAFNTDYALFQSPTWSGMPSAYAGETSFMASPPLLTTNPALTVNPNQVGRMPHALPFTTTLHVNPIPPKSRVETQIAIKLTLDPLPPGITKLHLPRQSISKAKLLAKDAERAPDTLELSTMLVCTSAMQNPENKARALRVARGEEILPPGQGSRRSSNGSSKKDHEPPVDPHDPTLPQNGGEVKICDNCINRERKRAARKKQRKQEEEDIWNSYERDRVIVFNTAEYQSFHTPTPMKEEPPESMPPFSPEAMQIDAPMRIACYCRHMNEKVGFQVIFTIRDLHGRFVAQTITQSIHITDDHKTHGPGVHPTQELGYSDQQQYNLQEFIRADPTAVFHGNLPHRQYHSTTDLATLERNAASHAHFGGPFSQTANRVPQGPSSTTGASHSRTLSRPASPTSQNGPKKKRKGSAGQPKFPSNLMMTRADQPQPLSLADISSTLAATSPGFSPDGVPYTSGADGAFALPAGAIQQTFCTAPTTPTSNLNMLSNANRSGSTENLSYFYSAPNSAHPSRAASPTSFSRSVNAYAAAQTLPGQSTTPFAGLQMGVDGQQQPVIHKILPGEGPVTGGIEVTCLGKNFHRSLEVMFGDNVATTTTHWGDSTLVCLLPPSALSGIVNVTFAHQHQQGYSPPPVTPPPVFFKYVDDRDRQLFETCIRIMSNKQNGPGQDPRAFAAQIIQDAMSVTAGSYGAGQSSGFGGNVMSIANKEEVMLIMLEKIDMDDSPYDADFNLQTITGQTMLTLACALGYLRLASGLLARGADPDTADIAGFTPLMIAAFHNHAQIVRRLILKGADPSRRNLKGFTASDLAASPEVASELRQVRHGRSRSNGTPLSRSRANSATSTRSLWGPPSSTASSSLFATEDESAVDSEIENEPFAQVAVNQSLRSRGNSTAAPLPALLVTPSNGAASVPANSPYAIMAAWRENLATQIQLFQQNATWAMPNFQLPNLPPIDLDQSFPSWRRLSSLVPNRPTFLSGAVSPDAASDQEGSDWPGSDTTAAPPPAYGDIFPENTDMPLDSKPPELAALTESTAASVQTGAEEAALPSSQIQQHTETKSSLQYRPSIPNRKPTLRLGRHTSEEQVAEIRQLRKEKLTSAKDDRNLWYIWFPLLVILVIWWYSGLRLPPVFNWLGTNAEAGQNRLRPMGVVLGEVNGGA